MRKQLAAVASVSAVMMLAACGTNSTAGSHPASPLTPHSSSQAVLAAKWLRISWPAAGFAARFPARPREITATNTFDGISITSRNAALKNGGAPIEVGSATIGETMPASQLESLLRSTVYGFAGAASTFSLESAGPTTYRGRRAYEGSFKHGTKSFELLVILIDGRHEVYVFAEAGATFNALSQSLELL